MHTGFSVQYNRGPPVGIQRPHPRRVHDALTSRRTQERRPEGTMSTRNKACSRCSFQVLSLTSTSRLQTSSSSLCICSMLPSFATSNWPIPCLVRPPRLLFAQPFLPFPSHPLATAEYITSTSLRWMSDRGLRILYLVSNGCPHAYYPFEHEFWPRLPPRMQASPPHFTSLPIVLSQTSTASPPAARQTSWRAASWM